MSTMFTKTLTFQSENLRKDATLMLAFNRKIDGMYDDKFPVCWKAIKFPASGTFRATVTYTNQISFSKPEVDPTSDTIVDASTFVNIDVGQKTFLTKLDDLYRFTAPEVDPGSTTMKGYNGTARSEDLTLNFIQEGDSAPTPLLFFERIGDGSFVQVDFAPIVHAYVTEEYKEAQIIRSEIKNTLIWGQNLPALDEDTIWDFKYNMATNVFTIVRA